jgi:hypothetical protein
VSASLVTTPEAVHECASTPALGGLDSCHHSS